MKKYIMVFALLATFSGYSWSMGEILKLNSSGTEYCPGSKPTNFFAKNNVVWLSIDSSNSASLYLDPSLDAAAAILNLEIESFSSNKASFSAFSRNGSDYLAIIGTFTFDSSGEIKSLKATFLRNGLIETCIAKGTTTGKRVN
jgi:hypothetical protein